MNLVGVALAVQGEHRGREDHVMSQVWLLTWWASSNSRTFISFFSCSNWINVGNLCLGVR